MKVSEMTVEQVLGTRKWPAWFTTDQARAQLQFEASTAAFRLVACLETAAQSVVTDHGTGQDCHRIAKDQRASEYWVYKFERGDWQICGHWYRRDNGTYGELI
jgi:hypothetical protein